MAVPSFLFGGSTGETPESIKRKRDLVRAIMGASNAPKNIGEGLNALGDGIVANVLDRRANKAEEAGQATASSLFNSILGSPSTPAAMPGATGSAMPSADAGGNIPMATATPPDEVRNLIAANVPPEMQAYATNLIGKESSFNPNAVSPTGATGLAQFTRGTGKDYGLVSDQGDMRRDPTANLKALVALTNDNRAGLTRALGRPPTDGELALAHQQGLQGATNLLSGKSVPGNNLAVNNVDPNMDPRAAANKIMSFYGGSGGGGQQVASLDPSAGMTAEAPIQPPPVNPPAPAPTPGYVDPRISTEARAPMQGPTQAAPQLAPPTTVANAPQVAAQPPVALPQPQPQQMAQNAPQQQGGQFAGVDPRLLQALQNPWLNDGQKQAVQILIQQQMQANDPMAQLQLQEQQLKLKALQNPSPEYEFITGKDGSVFRADKRAGNIESVYGGKPEQPTDVQEYEYAVKQLRDRGMPDEQIPDYSTWATSQKRAGASQVNIDQKAEGAFDKKLAEKQAEAFDTMATEGINARADLGVINELDGLLKGQGGTLSGLAGVAAKYGIGGEGVSDIQAANALINKLVPTQRAPGSGSMSDRDVEMFMRSLPSLWNTPGGNTKILGVMRGLTQYKQQQGEIADQVLMGEMTRQEARRKLRELPNPLADFGEKGNSPNGNPAAPSSPTAAPAPAGNSADIQAARDAIARGAPRDKVIQRLRDANIDPSGL